MSDTTQSLPKSTVRGQQKYLVFMFKRADRIHQMKRKKCKKRILEPNHPKDQELIEESRTI